MTIQLDDGRHLARSSTSRDGKITVINGTLGGRWDPAKFLPSLQDIPDPLNDGGYLCGDAGLTYQLPEVDHLSRTRT